MTAMREAWARTLIEVAAADDKVLVLDGDLATSTKADLFDQQHPDKFLQMGIAEQNLVGTAVGLATMGYVPWLSSFTVFLTHRAADPIRMLVAQTGANVKVVGSYSGLLTGLTGRTHQDVQDLAIMRAMPGMTVLAPADDLECAAMVRWATHYDGPVYLRVARDAVTRVFDAEPDYGTATPTPEVRVLRDGRDVALVSTGAQTSRVVDASELLAARGVEARVVHVPTVKPLDERALLDALDGFELVCSVEEHSVLAGLGGLVAEVLTASPNRARLHRIGLQDVWTESAPNDFLLDKYGLSPEQVASSVASALRRLSGEASGARAR